jgi:undecaprenyl phosphate N,N'-diacetylbacillosamine 1-phosphate transferase
MLDSRAGMSARTTLYSRFGKRVLDLVGSAGAFLALSPLLLAIAVLIKLTSRGPVLFLQERLGRNATTFMAFKFRTMTDKPREADTLYYTGDASEVTLVGQFLRRTKLDELPQVVNVLRGEMSLIGPRPQLPKQLAEFTEDAKLRLLVRPGLTGLAQVNGNTTLTWPERWHYDAEYVRTLSFRLDCHIVAKTLAVLLHGEERFTRRPDQAGKESS